MNELVLIIDALNSITWPGALGLLSLAIGAVGVAFAFAWWLRR